VIERENGTIRFTHPLLSSVIYADLGNERWSVHGRIAEIVDEPIMRAVTSRCRGERPTRTSPRSSTRRRAWPLSEAAAPPALKSLIHIRLAQARRFRAGFAAALEDARAALELADRLGDDALRFDALSLLTVLGFRVGDGEAPAHAARAHELATAVGDPDLLKEASRRLALVALDSGAVDAARVLLEREYHEWCERDEPFSTEVLWQLSWYRDFIAKQRLQARAEEAA
jgi:hypothetical protein